MALVLALPKGTEYDIGLQQVRDDTLKTMNAQMLVKSEGNVDTEFTFIFPIEMSKWFTDKIELRKGDAVVVFG